MLELSSVLLSAPSPYLQWLPIEYRINFKIANVTFRTLHSSQHHSSQPAYLHSALHVHHSTHSLRLSNINLLSVPFVRTSFSIHSFTVAAPKIWNSPFSSSNVYQPQHFSPSPQDSVIERLSETCDSLVFVFCQVVQKH